MDDLPNRLWSEISSYVPLKGPAVHPREELRAAFFDSPRRLFVGDFCLVREVVSGGELKTHQSGELDLVYSNRPLIYVDRDSNPLQASNSEPAFIFHLLELLDLQPNQRVLEIGSGMGWLVAIMSHVVRPSGHVTGIELDQYLSETSIQQLSQLQNISPTLICGDGNEGYPRNAPYDRIIQTASVYGLAGSVVDQLADSGVMVIPIQNAGWSEEVLVLRRDGDHLKSIAERLCQFVSLKNAHSNSRSGVRNVANLVAYSDLRSAKRGNARFDLHDKDGRLTADFTAFTSFMSKIDPHFVVVSACPDGPGSREYWSPDNLMCGIADDENGSLALWQNGVATAYRDNKALDRLVRGYSFWRDEDRPDGVDFRVCVSRDAPVRGWVAMASEKRGEFWFHWKLKAREERYGHQAA